MYCPRYCEENAWHLAQAPALAQLDRFVAVITSAEGACLFWNQQIADDPAAPVWWDYHVVLLARRTEWLVYDFDSTLPFPVEARAYLDCTFQYEERMPPNVRPRFLLFDGPTYTQAFRSDRSHMRDEQGGWLAPPPVWPQINGEAGGSFLDFITHHFQSGNHLSLAETRERFIVGPSKS